MKEIEFHQAIVDEKVSEYNYLLEIEKEFDNKLWKKVMNDFKRNYEKYGEINYKAVNYWANKLNIRSDELEKIIKKEIVTI